MDYSIRKRNDNISGDKPVSYYPYPRYVGKITLKRLAKDIEKASSLTRGDVENVIINLIDIMTVYLKDGQIIELDEFGNFRLSFSASGSETEEDANHHKIKKTKVLFHAGMGLTEQMKDIKFRKR